MKTIGIVLASLVLLSTLATTVTVGVASTSRDASAALPMAPDHTVSRGAMDKPKLSTTCLTLTTSDATPHVGQTFTLSGKLSASNGMSMGVDALELYRAVNDGEYKFFCTLTTQPDGTFSKNLTYNKAATLKYYAVFDTTILFDGSRSDKVTVTVTKAT